MLFALSLLLVCFLGSEVSVFVVTRKNQPDLHFQIKQFPHPIHTSYFSGNNARRLQKFLGIFHEEGDRLYYKDKYFHFWKKGVPCVHRILVHSASPLLLEASSSESVSS